MNEIFSVVIGISGNDEDRIHNFDLVLDCFQRQRFFDAYELVVVEQCIHGRYHRNRVQDRGFQYVEISGEPFSLPWCFNVGFRKTTAPVMVYMGAGSVFGPDFLKTIYEGFNGCYAAGWNEIIYLNELGSQVYKHLSERQLNDWSQITEMFGDRHKQRPNRHPAIGGCFGFAIVVDRWLVKHKLAGFNESFVNWGGDEVEFAQRARAITGMDPTIIPYRPIHLYHENRFPGDGFQSGPLYRASILNPHEVTSRLRLAGLGSEKGRRPIAVDDLLECLMR